MKNTMPQSQFEAEPDEDLLVYIGLDGDDGKEAWAEFYRRHGGFILGSLKKSWGSVLDEAEIEDAMHETFMRAHRYADSYKPQEESSDGELGSRRVRAWLGRIAQNVVKDMIAMPWAGHSPFEEADYEPPPEADEVDGSPLLQALVQALSELTEREQDVLRTTMLFWKPGEDHQRIPNDESKALALRWSTTPTNIRAVRSRAMRKLKSRVEQLLREEDS